MTTIEEHVQAANQIIMETLASASAGRSPEFSRLLETVLRERAPATTSPPWLLLPVLTCVALGGSVGHAQYVAAALDLKRIAAGCLDEWQDHDTKDALWQAVGPERAVNVAMALLSLSGLVLNRLDRRQIDAGAILDIKQEFEETLMAMCDGQDADLSNKLQLDEYEAVAGAKSGALLRLGCRAGALLAGAPPATVDLYGDFGYFLGIVAQVWNDLKGVAGSQGKMDAEKQRALPVLATLALGRPGYDPGSTEAQAAELFTLVRLQTYHQRAAEALAKCPSPGRLPLFLDDYSIRRLTERVPQPAAQEEGD